MARPFYLHPGKVYPFLSTRQIRHQAPPQILQKFSVKLSSSNEPVSSPWRTSTSPESNKLFEKWDEGSYLPLYTVARTDILYSTKIALKGAYKAPEKALSYVVVAGLQYRAFFLAGEFVARDVDPPSLHLDCLRNLCTLAIDGTRRPESAFGQTILGPLSTALRNSPDLQTLDVRVPFSWSMSFSFSDVLRSILDTNGASVLNIKKLVVEDLAMDDPAAMVLHLQYPSSLEVHIGGWNTEVGNFWNVLQTASVSLEVLKVYCDIDRTLLDYISHCHSRLKVLHLYGAAGKATDEMSDELADLFFGSVLLEFTQSLRELKICPSYEGRWCLGPHNVDMFFRCSNLETLSDDIVNRAHSFPKLKSLDFSTTDAMCGRGARSLSGRVEYAREMRSAIPRRHQESAAYRSSSWFWTVHLRIHIPL
ncbi:hypothetical protein D9758_003114 [Tetrapyrgos nigripes]|uniref:Uncharacterized protein n=1 Tax=Tetrapyrgos nigripes TaxID=182062 RepID=A0A8H5GQ40_9AGAR|nr:hypothetical protein D9758_003114 [Tetrapyrgos nigripes]